MTDIIKSSLLNCSGIGHGFCTRRGGASKGVFSNLNVGLGSSDDKETVLKNRRRAVTGIFERDLPLCTLYQRHSNIAVKVEDPWTLKERIEADAMVTTRSDIAIGILTADCVPVLLADPQAGVIAAAHAGWRGALDGIIESTFAEMVKLGANPQRTRAATGPAIQQNSYEVGPELRTRFLDANRDNSRFFGQGDGDRYLFDLPGFVRARLRAAGLNTIDVSPLDTYEDETRFFSYRRSNHRSEPDYGRQLSAICKFSDR